MKKTKKLISIRLDPKMIADIKGTGEGMTEFIEKACISRLRWMIQKKRIEEHKTGFLEDVLKFDEQIMKKIEAAKPQHYTEKELKEIDEWNAFVATKKKGD